MITEMIQTARQGQEWLQDGKAPKARLRFTIRMELPLETAVGSDAGGLNWLSRIRRNAGGEGPLGSGISICSSFPAWAAAGLLTCFWSLPVRAAEYSFVPDKMNGTQASSAVVCTTPTGWQGWKDDPHYWDSMSASNRQLVESAHSQGVSFGQPNCKTGPECASLILDTIGQDSRGQPDLTRGMRNFVRELQQHQDVRRDPDPCITRFGSFEAGKAKTP